MNSKLFFKVLFVVAVCIGLSFGANAAQGDVWLGPTEDIVTSNSSFDVDIYLDTGGVELGALNMYFDFDPTNISMDLSKGNNGLSQGMDASNYNLMANADDVSNGHFRFAGICAQGCANGSVVQIAKLHLMTKNSLSGTSTRLNMRVNELADTLGNVINVGTVSAYVLGLESPSVCGNGVVELGEQCDDGNTTTESCAYGQSSCVVCNNTCQSVAGATDYCGDHICSNNETCDDCPGDCGMCAIENINPIGSIDNLNSTSITGWAYDENLGVDPISVHIYINGDYSGQALADIYRSDLNSILGSANHGFVYNLPTLAPGDYQVQVFAINQPEGENPEISGSPRTLTIKAPDTTAPTGSLSINNGAVSTENQSVSLTIGANDESGLATMKISNTNDFASAEEEIFASQKYWTLSAGEGVKTVYLWLQDNVGNWTSGPITDTIEFVKVYPEISGVTVNGTTETTANISWQASGANYCEVYYGLNADPSLVEVANHVTSDLYETALNELSSGTLYNYYVSCENEYSNISISPIGTFSTKATQVLDTTAPGQIIDLSVDKNGPNSAVLYWTSPGDDNMSGLASGYDIRYSIDRIGDNNWDQAIQLSQEPAPQAPGSLESYIVVGLEPNTFYHFAVKTSDEAANWSVMSNIAKVKTDRGGTTTDDPSDPGTGPDKIPPGQAKKTDSYSSNSETLITWENPDDPDYTKTVVLQSEEPYSTTDSSGDLLAIRQGVFYTAAHSEDLINSGKHKIVYEGTREYYRGTGLENGKTYYYAIITMDGVPNYSDPVFVEATPDDHKFIIEKAKKEIKRLKEEYKHLANANRRLVESVSEDEADVVYNHGQFVDMSQTSVALYEELMTKQRKAMSTRQKYALAYFIEHGTPTTERLGAGERAGVINSYTEAFGDLPRSVSDYKDVIKIANGRWPGKKRDLKKQEAENNFQKVYKRSDDSTNNTNDNAAVSIMTYGLRPVDRNFDSEKRAIDTFEHIYGHKPAKASEWDIVRAIAYSGASR